MTFPPIEEIDRIAAMEDAAARNREITRAYHLLSIALAKWIPGGANWCTFAAWASRQAGQTIRRQDLIAAIERHPLLAAPLAEFRAATGIEKGALAPLLDQVLRHFEPIRRSSEAVGRGNRKVFEEIAREFARFLRDFGSETERDDVAIEDFVAAFRSGPPPDGQDQLKLAFRAFHRARHATGKERAEWLLLGNLRVGFHEQTRLQPEIKESLDAAAVEPELIAGGLLGALLGRAALVREIRSVARIVVTQKLMALDLGGETLRLKQDLTAGFPEDLRHLVNPELVALLSRIDATADSTKGSGALDWADFNERIHYIADLFRTHQQTESLFLEPS